VPAKLTIFVCIVFPLALLSGQTSPRRATISGDGQAREGKCTIEVVVDEVAEVELRGDNGLLRSVSGQPAQWRRFQCNAPMPLAPLGVRFQGIDGRGRQQLVENPSPFSGSAVIRIEDSRSGSEAYTFDVMWTGAGDPRQAGGGFGGGLGGARERDFDGDRGRDRRGFGARTGFDEAMRSCEDAVIDQALDRLHPQVLVIRRTAGDDNPGRNDWIIGTFEVRRGRDWDRFRFECAVTFSSGRVRDVSFQPAGRR
jgi:hypothetical protein